MTMTSKLSTALTGVQPLIFGCAALGCATAAVITGHISGTDYLAVLGGLGIIGGTATTAHVVGAQVNQAAGTAPPNPAPPAGPPRTV